MNGRLYDPVVGRFFSPDNYVQLPDNPQSYNRYSYCLNNPLKYTDPSGQSFIGSLILGAVINMAINFASQCIAGNEHIDWGSIEISALTGAISGGINNLFNVTGFWNGAIWGGVEGAVSNGLQYLAYGGKIGDVLSGTFTGALSGGFSGAMRAKTQGLDPWSGKEIRKAQGPSILFSGRTEIINPRRIFMKDDEISLFNSGYRYMNGAANYCYNEISAFIIDKKIYDKVSIIQTVFERDGARHTTNLFLDLANKAESPFYLNSNSSSMANSLGVDQWCFDGSRRFDINIPNKLIYNSKELYWEAYNSVYARNAVSEGWEYIGNYHWGFTTDQDGIMRLIPLEYNVTLPKEHSDLIPNLDPLWWIFF